MVTVSFYSGSGWRGSNQRKSSYTSEYLVYIYIIQVHFKPTEQSIMGSLYDFNHRPENWDIRCWNGPCNKAEKERDIAEGRWSGPYGRRALQLAYTFAFTCLLRVDEVMKIRASDIKLLDDETIELTLPFRKTSQFGGRIKLSLVLCLLNQSECIIRNSTVCITRVSTCHGPS